MQQPSPRKQKNSMTRRTFMKAAGTATALTAASWSRVSGANDRIGIGMVGIGLMGRIHTRNFAKLPDASVVAICDVYDPRAQVGAEIVGGNVATCRDFRKLLDNKDIDALVIATPDHWHGMMTMMACAAGKDVYVEKPLTLFVREGRWMIDVAKRYKRVVQVGVQNRSGPNFQRAREFVQQGKLGSILAVQDTYCRNLMPGFGNPPDQEPPKELDWDLWLGPAPQRAYNPNRGIYHFRWIWDYAGGQMTNLGQHSLDIVQWFTGVNAPKSVYSTGGRFYLKDNMETPDNQDVLIDYGDFTGICQYREATAGRTGSAWAASRSSGPRARCPWAAADTKCSRIARPTPSAPWPTSSADIRWAGRSRWRSRRTSSGPRRQKDDTGDGAKDYVAARAELPRLHPLAQAADRGYRERARRRDDVPSGQYLPADRPQDHVGRPEGADRRRPRGRPHARPRISQPVGQGIAKSEGDVRPCTVEEKRCCRSAGPRPARSWDRRSAREGLRRPGEIS